MKDGSEWYVADLPTSIRQLREAGRATDGWGFRAQNGPFSMPLGYRFDLPSKSWLGTSDFPLTPLNLTQAMWSTNQPDHKNGEEPCLESLGCCDSATDSDLQLSDISCNAFRYTILVCEFSRVDIITEWPAT